MIYWLSTETMTITVVTDSEGKIIESPPVTRKFLGQPIENLRRWMDKTQKGFKWEIISYK